ncbi:MAG: prealbumin-like fold domain-containing protein [Eubacteriales bacterium]|nr:prealbumin-like fold domain-containing protein [Eubacteriales bacterium]
MTVVPAFEKDADGKPTGKIIADPVIKKGDAATESVVFNNTSRTGSLRLTKTSKGHSTPDDAEFIITGPDGYRRIVEYGELKGGRITISGLPAGTYTVKEEKADVDGYVLTVDGRETAAITKDNSTAEIALVNTYTPEEQGGKDTPSSGTGTDNSKTDTEMNGSGTGTEKTSSSKTGTNTPNTGDSSDWIHWMLLSAESAALLVVLLLSRKPRKE